MWSSCRCLYFQLNTEGICMYSGCGELACKPLPGGAATQRSGLELLPMDAGSAMAVRSTDGITVLALGGGSVRDAHFAPGAAPSLQS